MGQFVENIQYKLKTSSSGILLVMFKIFVGFMLGLTLSLIGEQMTGYGTFAFLLVIVSAIVTFYRIVRSWKWPHILAFTFCCILIAVLLQMYIQMAPGA